MIEADVVIGRLYGENDSVAKRPIMAHPPATESDISLTDFVNNIVAVCIISRIFINIDLHTLIRHEINFSVIYLGPYR